MKPKYPPGMKFPEFIYHPDMNEDERVYAESLYEVRRFDLMRSISMCAVSSSSLYSLINLSPVLVTDHINDLTNELLKKLYTT